MEGQGAIYNTFLTFLEYFFPADVVTQYKEVFVFICIVAVLAFLYSIVRVFKRLLGGN
jgi:hypothetical protein